MANTPPERGTEKEKPESIKSDAGARQDTSSAATSNNLPRFDLHGLWLKIKKATGWLAPLLVVATVLLGIVGWFESRIDKAVERKLSDEAILRKIAAHARPSLTFDATESIIADMGAAQFVKDIRVAKRKSDGWPERVEIDFTRAFQTPPIVTSLYDSVQIGARRGRLFAWTFDVHWSVAPPTTNDTDRLYRLEVVP
ncbi:MAG TPA: hypothetical protein VFT34_11225 [Verrucomicrobiae bacterium]|nr:hypothetical protein [Verrucomicrobiae bacterium]